MLCCPWTRTWMSLGLHREESRGTPRMRTSSRSLLVSAVNGSVGAGTGEGECESAVSPTHPRPVANHSHVCSTPGGEKKHFRVIFRHYHRKVNIDCFMIWQPLLTGHCGWLWSLSAEFSHGCNSCTSLLNTWHCLICPFPCLCSTVLICCGSFPHPRIVVQVFFFGQLV